MIPLLSRSGHNWSCENGRYSPVLYVSTSVELSCTRVKALQVPVSGPVTRRNVGTHGASVAVTVLFVFPLGPFQLSLAEYISHYWYWPDIRRFYSVAVQGAKHFAIIKQYHSEVAVRARARPTAIWMRREWQQISAKYLSVSAYKLLLCFCKELP